MKKRNLILGMALFITCTVKAQESSSESHCKEKKISLGLDFNYAGRHDLDVSGGAWVKVKGMHFVILAGAKDHETKRAVISNEGKLEEIEDHEVTALGTIEAEFNLLTLGKNNRAHAASNVVGVPYVSFGNHYTEIGTKAQYLYRDHWGFSVGVNVNSDRKFFKGLSWHSIPWNVGVTLIL